MKPKIDVPIVKEERILAATSSIQNLEEELEQAILLKERLIELVRDEGANSPPGYLLCQVSRFLRML
ncbi:hypothetical protein K1719_039496 [Acacia pycnantha]|nr:hypothetical protein K1719_039496 [Acacia pycnantha]